MKANEAHRSSIGKREVDLEDLYPAHHLSVPIDFFHNDTRYEPHTNGKHCVAPVLLDYSQF